MADNLLNLLINTPIADATGGVTTPPLPGGLLDTSLNLTAGGAPQSGTGADLNLGLPGLGAGADANLGLGGTGGTTGNVDLSLLGGSGGGVNGVININLLDGLFGGGAGGTGGAGGGTGAGGTGTGGASGAGTGEPGTGGAGGTGTGGAGTGGTGTGGAGTGGTGTGGTGGTGGAGGAPVSTDTAFTNVLRVDPAAMSASVQTQLDTLQGMVDSGAITHKQALLQIVNAAAPYTSVAVTTYQFFTGLTPTQAGLDYLVNSAINPTDLNDLYYAPFNLENRYINFASNLGLHSEVSPSFAAIYGQLTFDQTVRNVYEKVIGSAEATEAGVNPEAAINDIIGRKSYFEAVAHERLPGENQDLAVKLAAIGYVIEEAVRANFGNYGEANQNFLYDLADGSAQFHVDLVGVYGPNTVYDV